MKTLILLASLILTACQDKVFEAESVKQRSPKFPTAEERESAEKFLADMGYNKNDPAKFIESFTSIPNQSLIQMYLDSGFHSPYVNPMVEAASTGNMKLIKYLVEERGMYVNSGEAARTSPLNAAIQSQHHEVINYFLDKGAVVNVEDDYGRSPLMIAIKVHDLDTVRQLVLKKADLNKPDYLGNTPLMYAASSADMNIFKILLDGGANPHATNLFKRNLVHAAAKGGNPEILRLLIQKNVNNDVKDINGDTPLMIAISRFNIPQIDLLLENGASAHKLDKDGDSLLNQTLRTVLNAEIEVEDQAKLLNIDPRDDFPVRTDLGLHRAYLIVLRLLNHYSDPNVPGRDKETPLMLASLIVHGGIIEKLIHEKAELNLKDKNGDTALHYAVLGGNPFNIEKLLLSGANPNMKNQKGETPLALARKLGNKSVIDTFNKPLRQAQEEK